MMDQRRIVGIIACGRVVRRRMTVYCSPYNHPRAQNRVHELERGLLFLLMFPFFEVSSLDVVPASLLAKRIIVSNGEGTWKDMSR